MSAASKRTLFVIQPFTKGTDEVYQLIAAAAADANLTSVRADSLEAAGSITEEIEKVLSPAAVIVADVTDATPNVMYEIAVARAKNRPLILVASSSRDIPFDLARF